MKLSFSPRILTCYALLLLLVACGGETHESRAGLSMTPASPPVADNVVELSGQRTDYLITQTATQFQIKNKQSGVTALHPLSTTVFKFSDLKLNTNMQALSTSIPANELKILVELYVAFFNRVPDAEGLSYWINEKRAGKSIKEIADIFYGAAILYSEQTGYTAQMSNADFVKIIYKNVLGRSGPTAPPEEDVAYWAGELNTGKTSKGGLILTILDVAHQFTNHPQFGWVPQLLDNKYTVAADFAITQGLTYVSGQESIIKTMAIANAVTPTNITVAKDLFKVVGFAADMRKSPPQLVGEPKLTIGSPSLLELTFDMDMDESFRTEGAYTHKSSGWRSDKRTFFIEMEAYEANGRVTFFGTGVTGQPAFSSAEHIPISEDIVFYFPKSASQLLDPPVIASIPQFTSGATPTLEFKFDSAMQASYAVEGSFNAKAMYWKSDKRSFVIEFSDFIPGSDVTLSGVRNDGQPGFISTANVAMNMPFIFRLPQSGTPGFSKIISGPTFTAGTDPKITISFDRVMGPGFVATGDYVPKSSYWTADRKTFVIEFISYTPGGTIQFMSDGFRSASGDPMAETVMFKFPN
ncbi:DUF4214 domain-containing protein [Undibacterium flavidum]|uniref:DUF4214 domain-containing protein n=1 Tax=Undibacterium flavidum TaxID=2762297 RepID=A0ABR6YBM0_9BURK|nr:DUF4214 domain-containing protein [Undibacterium flavidum]MBC3874039.1 DUF4214 domain-containing protein [Undibacterium flavidum]